jgi:DNA topoisomerase-6 subunit B
MMIDTVKNAPKVNTHLTNKNPDRWHGIKVELEAEGNYVERYQSIPEYLKQTAIANPHARITFKGPNGKMKFDRVVSVVPKQPKEIKPHPYGIELGILRRMLATTRTKNVRGFLMTDFSRVGARSADQILRLAKIESKRKAESLDHSETSRLHKSMQMVKLIAPPTNCLSPLTEDLIVNGLKKEINADYYVASTRPPAVYRGNPFQVEVGLAYGGDLNPNTSAHLYRFGNKVPLLYHQRGCALTQSVEEVDWRRYSLQQSGGMPVGPIVILVHFASVWVPFTSEGKEAIANYPEIIKEVKLALQEGGRQLHKFIRQRRKVKQRHMRKKLFERYIPEVAEGLGKLTGKSEKTIKTKLENTMKKDKEVSKIVNGEDLEEKKQDENKPKKGKPKVDEDK